MPGYRIEDDPEFQEGRKRLETAMKNPEEPEGAGCSVIGAILISGSSLLAAYIGHKYGAA